MSSPNVTFEQIPAIVRKPGVYSEFNTKLSAAGVAPFEQKVCLVAPMLATGTAAANTPQRIFDPEKAAVLFGRGSILHRMALAAFDENGYLDLTGVGVADAGASSKASGTITLAGTATAFGTLVAYIGADRIEIPILSGGLAATAASTLKDEITNRPDLPVTASVSGAAVTITARNGGTVGNLIPITAAVDAPGVSATVVAMSGGATDPDLAATNGPLDAIFGAHFHLIASAWSDATQLAKLKSHIVEASAPLEKRRGHIVFAITSGSIAEAGTIADGLNSERMFGTYMRGVKLPSFELAAGMAAIAAGVPDPVLPLKTLPVTRCDVPNIADRLSRIEQETIIASGLTPLEVRGGEIVRIVRAVTTSTKNAMGNPDTTLSDFGRQRGLDYYAVAVENRIETVFGRAKLSSKTPAKVRDQIYSVAKQLEDLEILTEVDAYADRFIVERDSSDFTRLNARIPAPLVVGFMVQANVIDLYL